MSRQTMHDRADRYIAWWQGLPGTLDQTEAVFAPNGRFVDPFSDVRGASAIRHHLQKTYDKLDDVVITVTDRALGEQVLYLRWTFALRFGRRGRRQTLIGMSEVHSDQGGRVTLHYDHWDAASQVYETLPLLGTILRAAKKRITR